MLFWRPCVCDEFLNPGRHRDIGGSFSMYFANGQSVTSRTATIIGLSGHCWRGNLPATIARRCSAAAGPRVASLSKPNAPIARCRSAAEVAAARWPSSVRTSWPSAFPVEAAGSKPTVRLAVCRWSPALRRWPRTMCRSPDRRPRSYVSSEAGLIGSQECPAIAQICPCGVHGAGLGTEEPRNRPEALEVPLRKNHRRE